MKLSVEAKKSVPFMNKARTSGKKKQPTMAGDTPVMRAKFLQNRSVILHFVQKCDESTFRKIDLFKLTKQSSGYYRYNYRENIWGQIK